MGGRGRSIHLGILILLKGNGGMDSTPRDWISAWNFPGKTKITPHEPQMLSNPSDVFRKKTWKAKWGMDRCDGQVRELKMERQRRGGNR